MIRPAISALVIAALLHAADGRSAAWEEMGPTGGMVTAVAVNPAGTTKMYALSGTRVLASPDAGVTWRERPTPTGCTPSSTSSDLQVRPDGVVFVNCNGRNLRSDDEGRTWLLVGGNGFTFDVPLVFDPRNSRRAVVRRATYQPASIAFTDDDANTFTAPIMAIDAPVPSLLAWDLRYPDRLVGIGVELHSDTGGDDVTVLYQSNDYGAHWTRIATVGPIWGPRICFPRTFLVDAQHRMFVHADCGLFRSLDGGSTWQKLNDPADYAFARLVPDPTNTERFLIIAAGEKVSESLDAGVTWSGVPVAPDYVLDIAIAPSGQLFAATVKGVFRFDAALRSWEDRNGGLHARALQAVEPARGVGVTLSGFRLNNSTGNFRSVDGGASWTGLAFDRGNPVELRRNANVPNSVFAAMDSGALYKSTDGGASWTEVSTQWQPTGLSELIVSVAPIGPQPGLVYGVYRTCEIADHYCAAGAQGAARSVDGGKSWVRANAGIESLFVDRVVPSPANGQVAMLGTSGGIWVTLDGGIHWDKRGQDYGRVVPDPFDPARWYAVSSGYTIQVTTDAGLHWTPLGTPWLISPSFELLVDPQDPQRLYAVGTRADISLSMDRGITWAIVVAPSATLALAPFSARLGPETVTTIYAAGSQGVVKNVVATASVPIVAKAIEFYRASADHYFITTDNQEIAKLDSGALSGWTRTGLSFNVFVNGKDASFEVSPVCRFYGRPEKGLDSHFYSASPAECQAVRDRFADAWIDESPSVFGVPLPSFVEGLCPNGTTPVYRLYNNRADANHRYVMWPTVRETMIALGWKPEGYGPSGVAMCALW